MNDCLCSLIFYFFFTLFFFLLMKRFLIEKNNTQIEIVQCVNIVYSYQMIFQAYVSLSLSSFSSFFFALYVVFLSSIALSCKSCKREELLNRLIIEFFFFLKNTKLRVFSHFYSNFFFFLSSVLLFCLC